MSGRLVLLRHGQSQANVERRLDTRPPGAALTPLGRDQARTFATYSLGSGRPALLTHSVATRALQTAAVIGAKLDLPAYEVGGIHEVQVGELENRSDDTAVDEFNAIYERWHHGELDLRLPGGETGNEGTGALAAKPMPDDRLRRPKCADSKLREAKRMPGKVKDGLEDLRHDVLPAVGEGLHEPPVGPGIIF